MVEETDGGNVSSGLGFAAMFGGGLFVAIYLGLSAVGTDSYATMYTFNVVSAVPVLLFVFGTVGLFHRHRESFGWLGRIGTAVLVVGFLLSVLNSAWLFATGEHLLSVTLQWGYILTEVLGALLLGAAIAHARDLSHALAGGLLLALGLPFSLGLWLGVIDPLELGSTLLAAAVFSIPFGAGWLVLGYDLVTETSQVEPAAG